MQDKVRLAFIQFLTALIQLSLIPFLLPERLLIWKTSTHRKSSFSKIECFFQFHCIPLYFLNYKLKTANFSKKDENSRYHLCLGKTIA